jgi:hypothetical protein
LKPHLRKCWVIPPQQNAAFVACMEDVLDLYQQPLDLRRPLVCMDEQPVQLVKETRIPLPPQPGHPLRYDYEYERAGTTNNFLFIAPLMGWRKVNVRDTKTRGDWAHEIKELLDVDFPDVDLVRLVCDNLNTHNIASLYQTFEPEEARRLARRLEIHYTPKHGSWLNIAESELSILTQQCLDRRLPDAAFLRREVTAWYGERNQNNKLVDWQFTTDDARIKLKRLYPQFQN